MNDSNKGEIINTELKGFNRLIERYKLFCYSLGRFFDESPPQDLAKQLYQADFDITPGMYMSLAGVTSIIAAGAIFTISLPVFQFLSMSSIYSFIISILTFGLSLGGFPFTLYNKISAKKMDVEYQLPYALSYMSVIASSGSPPIEVLRRISVEDYGGVSSEFAKVIYRVDVLGEDGNTAMSHLIQNTPSELFRGICIDIANSIQSGGGFRTYLDMKSKELISMRWETQKQFVESLSVYGEGYLSGVIMSVVLVVLMIVVASALGLELGMDARVLFNTFVYGLVPLINIVFLVLLWMKYSGSSA
ncbi:MAG: type II secretion system F family protein [Methanohalobium sp.]|uniref:type II secretion system F family protein n=1 Tax=Methanohalobium sp. TaxID=2837493 RepID=UPI003979692D